MRAKLHVTFGALVTILSWSISSYAALPAMSSEAQTAYAKQIQQLKLIGHNQGQGQGASNSGVSSLTPQEKDNQNLKNRFSRIDPNDPNAARKEKLMNDSIIGLMGVESSSTLDGKLNWNTSGPDTGSQGRARGFSQVMDNHLTSTNPNEWAMKYLGQAVDPNYYNSNPELQVKLTTGVIGDWSNELVNKYPDSSDQQLRSMIYSKWFTGSYGNANSNISDGYTSSKQYVYKAENFLAKAYNKYGNNLPAISTYIR